MRPPHGERESTRKLGSKKLVHKNFYWENGVKMASSALLRRARSKADSSPRSLGLLFPIPYVLLGCSASFVHATFVDEIWETIRNLEFRRAGS